MKKFHPLTVAEVRRETEDAVSIRFEVPVDLADDFDFIQGQYVTVKIDLDGEDVRRNYSVCEAPGAGLRIAVKEVEGGRFSTWANRRLKAGDRIEVFPPMGRFHTDLDPSAARAYVAFAAGSGITPILSLIKATLAIEPQSNFMLFFGNRTPASILFKDELGDLKDRYMTRLQINHILSRSGDGVGALDGRFDDDKVAHMLDRLIDVGATHAFFICGPEPMMDTVERALRARDVPAERIHVERFVNAAPTKAERPDAGVSSALDRPPTPAEGVAVTAIMDSRRARFTFKPSDHSVLDAARAAGLDAPYACKGGVCCTCRAKVLEGAVEMAACYGLEPDEIAAGYVLTCQSRPTTPTLALSYDD